MKKITFTTALLASACAFAGFEGHVSADGYVPGLQQGIFRDGGLADISFYATCAEADRFSHTLGTILADVSETSACQARNELTGKLETWPQWGAVLYEGEMYFEGGKEYNFFGCVDDLVACELDGVFFWCEGNQQVSKRGVRVYSKMFKESGWHPIRMWLADPGGGLRGAWSGFMGFQNMGIGWNTNGCKIVNGTTQLQWNRLLDDGNGRLLRSKVLPQKSVNQDECGPVGTKDGEVRVFGAQDGLPIEIEMVWVPGRGEVEGFWMSKDRITQWQYKIIMGYNPVKSDKQDDDAPVNGFDTVGFIWNLNARYTGVGRFARMSDTRWKLAAKYCSVGLPLEAASLRVVFKPVDRRNSEREEQKLVKRGSDIAFETMLAKDEAKRYSLADGLDLDMIKVEGCGDTFYLGRYEVTQEQYEKVMASNPSGYGGADNMPVSSVNWANATEFCKKLNALVPVEGMTWTLPSTKQWSFAANGGLKKKGNSFFGGDDWHEVGWWGANEYGNWWTHPVGLKKPNELEFHDLFGNVWEWCCDDDGRKDHKYISGVGIGAWYLMEFIVCVNANQNNGDYGFRVALVPNAQLVHRWSFTKDFVDSIGKVEAKRTAKIVKLEDGKCVCEKGGLDLGDALQGAGTPFTVELWYLETKHEYGGRVFTASAPNSEVGWATGDGNEGFFYVVRQKSEEDQARGTPEMQFGLNRWYYLAITYDGVNVTGYKCDLEGDQQVRSYPVPLNLMDRERILKLGTTCWGDLGVFAKYDEVRVWKGCKSKEDIEPILVS